MKEGNIFKVIYAEQAIYEQVEHTPLAKVVFNGYEFGEERTTPKICYITPLTLASNQK